MPDYKNGKIYRIVSPNTPDVYIGSTAYPYLSWRYRQHLYTMRKYPHVCSASAVMDAGEPSIELLEAFPCERSCQLREREQQWLDNEPNAINKRRAFKGGKL